MAQAEWLSQSDCAVIANDETTVIFVDIQEVRVGRVAHSAAVELTSRDEKAVYRAALSAELTQPLAAGCRSDRSRQAIAIEPHLANVHDDQVVRKKPEFTATRRGRPQHRKNANPDHSTWAELARRI